jgi:hypothetical protein
MSRILLILLSMLLHGYVGLRLMPSLAGSPLAGPALGVLLATSALLMPLSLIGRNLRWPGARTALAWSGMLAMGLFSSLFVLTLLRDALLLASAALGALWPSVLAPEWVAQATAWAVLAAAATVTVLGAWNARRTAAVVRVDVPVTDLPDALHGFTIAQISDIHVGPTIRGGYLQAIVDRVNRLEADMVAVTGSPSCGAWTCGFCSTNMSCCGTMAVTWWLPASPTTARTTSTSPIAAIPKPRFMARRSARP